MWHNTTRGLRLFIRAAFTGLEPDRQAAGPDDRVVCALFSFGAIAAAAELGQLTSLARRRCELGFLRRTYGAGFWDARSIRRDLYRRAKRARGRRAVGEGRVAVVEWLRGADPAWRLRELIERLPGERLPARGRGPAPFRRWSAREPSRVPLQARR